VLYLIIFLHVFLIARNGFSLKPKQVVSNKTDINSVVVDGLYFPSTVHVSNGMTSIKKMDISNSHRILAGEHKGTFS
jgi:hypothetical protein